MEDQYNLIYNGKMIHGMDGYATSIRGLNMTIDTADKPIGCAASYVMPYTSTGQLYYNNYGFFPLIPYLKDDTYNISFQIKANSSFNYTSYFSIVPYDNKGKIIEVDNVCIIPDTVTTLAQDLKDGDTTVYLTDVSNWVTPNAYHDLGIIESAAYGDNRCLYWQRISKDSIDSTNNTLTLRSAWAGGTYKAGSKVREFRASAFYYFPVQWSAGQCPTTWTPYSKNFTKSSDTIPNRLDFTYFLGIGHLQGDVKFADFHLENLSEPQARIPSEDESNTSKSSVNQYGQLNTGMLSEGFLPVRYIRDWASTRGDGTGAQAYPHWKEIQAFDRWGRNVAFAADGNWSAVIYKDGAINTSRAGLNISNTTTYKPLHVITNEVLDDTAYIESSSTTQGNPRSVTIDMGIVHYIDKIIVWHDSQYSNQWHDTKTEVSADGVNWITVFDSAIEGEYQETSAGHTITFDKLGTLYHASMRKGGETLVQDIIED